MTRSKAPTSLKSGMIWNLASLGFLALAGLVLNFAIARFYGPDTLGIFNIAFALFIFASQFGTFGIHFSILQSVSENYGRDNERSDAAATSGVIAVAVISTVIVLLCWALVPLAEYFYAGKADGIGTAILVILPGLWAFSINKALFNIINGARHMRAFAVLQALRYVFMLVSFIVMAARGVDGLYLTVVFSISELLLLPILVFYSGRVMDSWRRSGFRHWWGRHRWFGARIFLSGAVLELNTRVDVLMLGYFLNAESAGIYSVAALVAEGAGQAIFAIRNNVNPLLTRFIVDKDYSGLLKFSRKSVLLFTPFMAVVSIVAIFVYPYFVRWGLEDMAYMAAKPALLILLIAITISSGLMIYNMLFSQTGHPALHTVYVLGILSANIILNLIFIPIYGIIGAALATAGAYITSAVLLIIMARKFLKIRLLV